MNLAEFLLREIAADEEVTRAATPGRWKLWGMSVMADQDGTSNVATALDVAHTAMRIDGKPRTFDATHIARWDPARVLAECAAKRAIVDLMFAHAATIDGEWGCCHDGEAIAAGMCPEIRPDDVDGLRLLAQPYRDREGYRTEWDVT